MLGDQTLFIRGDEAEAAWAVVDPIVTAWRSDRSPFPNYEAGTWGPAAAARLLERDGTQWRRR